MTTPGNSFIAKSVSLVSHPGITETLVENDPAVRSTSLLWRSQRRV